MERGLKLREHKLAALPTRALLSSLLYMALPCIHINTLVCVCIYMCMCTFLYIYVYKDYLDTWTHTSLTQTNRARPCTSPPQAAHHDLCCATCQVPAAPHRASLLILPSRIRALLQLLWVQLAQQAGISEGAGRTGR